MKENIKVAAIVVNRDRPDLTDNVVGQIRLMGQGLKKDTFVIECGSSPKGRSKYMTHWFWDPFYRGRYYAFNRGLSIARRKNEYDYYWFVVNDVVFPETEDTLRELVDTMEENPRMALISPAEPDADDYFGCFPKKGRRWHKASTVHGLAFLMKKRALDEVGFCSPSFKYSQGAGTELAYKLYKNGWFLAYSDKVTLKHLGGTTYGKIVKTSRHEYLRRSREFATKYLTKHYGRNWDKEFAKVLPSDVEVNTFPWQKKVWEKKLEREPLFLWVKIKIIGSWIKQHNLKFIKKTLRNMHDKNCLKLAVVSIFDTNNTQDWSGIPFYMTKSLRKYFPTLDIVGPLRYKDSWILKKKNLIYQRFFQSKFFPQYDISSLKYFARQVSEKIQEKEIDVIFSIHPDPIAFFQTDKPIVFTSDATFASLLRLYPALRNLSRESVRNGHLLFQRAIDKCALAIFPSEWAAESARQDYGAASRKVHVIPYGANIDHDQNRDDIIKLIESRSKNVCKLLFIGVDWERKRANTAVRIAVELNRRGLKTELYIAGCHSPSGKSLPNFVKTLGYIDKRSKAGGGHLRKLFEESHFFVLPSQAECFGLVFCEANSFGMPCIAANIGGIPTIFKDNLNGKLFTLEDMVEGATQYILQMFPQFNHYRELCLSSFEEYKNRLNWDTFCEKLRELIVTVL